MRRLRYANPQKISKIGTKWLLSLVSFRAYLVRVGHLLVLNSNNRYSEKYGLFGVKCNRPTQMYTSGQ